MDELSGPPGIAVHPVPARKILEFCKRLGIAIKRPFLPDHVEEMLAAHGTWIDKIENDSDTLDADWKQIPCSLSDAVCFVGRDGWLVATIWTHGAFSITNLANIPWQRRQPGHRDSADRTIEYPSLDVFTDLLVELLGISDLAIDEILKGHEMTLRQQISRWPTSSIGSRILLRLTPTMNSSPRRHLTMVFNLSMGMINFTSWQRFLASRLASRSWAKEGCKRSSKRRIITGKSWSGPGGRPGPSRLGTVCDRSVKFETRSLRS